jgi:hypothetical protein
MKRTVTPTLYPLFFRGFLLKIMIEAELGDFSGSILIVFNKRLALKITA